MNERERVHHIITGDLERVVPDVVAAIREQIPAYRSLSPAQVAEVSAIAAWATSRVLELWAQDGELSAGDLSRFHGIGAARALDGRPLPVILRAYRVAGTRLTDLVAEVGGERLSVADAMALARLWMASIDTLSEALYAGHSAAADRVTRDRDQALADLLADLLAGRQATRTALADRCRELGVTLPSTPLVLVVEAAEALGGVEPRTLGTLGTLGDLGDLIDLVGVEAQTTVLTRVHDGHGVVLLPSADALPAALAAALGARGWRGCAVQAQSLSDAPRAHRLAAGALAGAPARSFADRALLDEGDAQVLGLLATHRDADPRRAVTALLGPIASQPHLIEGLDAFLATGSATAAAGLLGVHAQTMRYRMRRIVDLTGRDPRRPWDRFTLEVARTLPTS